VSLSECAGSLYMEVILQESYGDLRLPWHCILVWFYCEDYVIWLQGGSVENPLCCLLMESMNYGRWILLQVGCSV
jgi:hypothetical protein